MIISKHKNRKIKNNKLSLLILNELNLIKTKQETNENIFNKKFFFYTLPEYMFNDSKEFRTHLIYNIYQNKIIWIQNKIFKNKYNYFVNLLHDKKLFLKLAFKKNSFLKKNTSLYKKTIIRYLYLYTLFFEKTFQDIYYFLKWKHLYKKNFVYNLILTFNQTKFFVNFLNSKKNKNYFSLTTGLFVKYFGKKKALKKNKILKLLMGKYVRKLFLILQINKLILTIKNNPIYLFEFLKNLNSPIVHKFFNPYDKTLIEDTVNATFNTKSIYFIFYKNTSYSTLKTKKRGRIKRKISRKLILKNQLID